MRLSEDRINTLSAAIAKQLVKKRMVVTQKNLRQVAAWVEKPILEHLAREDDIDEAVTDYIKGLAKPPPEGSFDYQALFQKKKEEMSRRRGIKI